jgi:uncharacterized repeat protein (TIGR01451 family)
MLLGGAAAVALGGAACPGLAQAATAPQRAEVSAQAGAVRQDPVRSAPFLTIHKTHQEPVDHTVAYTLWVTNEGTGSTDGAYTVTDKLPDGLTATSAKGRHWNCDTNRERTQVTCKSDEHLSPHESSGPITIRTRITDEESCFLVNIAAVSGGARGHRGDEEGNRGVDREHRDRGVQLTKDVLQLPCHHREGVKDGANVNVDVNGNNNGGSGGDSSGATANGNGHIHDITGGIATAEANASANAGAKAHNGNHQHHRR